MYCITVPGYINVVIASHWQPGGLLVEFFFLIPPAFYELPFCFALSLPSVSVHILLLFSVADAANKQTPWYNFTIYVHIYICIYTYLHAYATTPLKTKNNPSRGRSRSNHRSGGRANDFCGRGPALREYSVQLCR